jgi:sugar phosphate isomerase/epimerase
VLGCVLGWRCVLGDCTMFTLSAFADEISPDPKEQIAILQSCGVRHIELRSIHKTNVLDLSDAQLAEFKQLLADNGFKLSAIGSPIGKVLITDAFEPHFKRFQRAVELCAVFNTPNIRLFSYYLPPGSKWSDHRQEVMDRMRKKVEYAAQHGVRLLHENEHNIYGEDPELVLDLLKTINHPNLRAIYDPANYVHGGYDPLKGWELTKSYTVHFHIKDWVHGEKHGRIPGEGHGRIAEVMADAVALGFDGFATMEPHLLGGGPTGGVTGPELFPKAVAAFKRILDQVGGKYA